MNLQTNFKCSCYAKANNYKNKRNLRNFIFQSLKYLGLTYLMTTFVWQRICETSNILFKELKSFLENYTKIFVVYFLLRSKHRAKSMFTHYVSEYSIQKQNQITPTYFVRHFTIIIVLSFNIIYSLMIILLCALCT